MVEDAVVLRVCNENDDFFEFEVSVNNGSFAGITKLYTQTEKVNQAGVMLEGFPKWKGDDRQIVFGAFGDHFAGGALLLHFTCIGANGDSVVEIKLEDELRITHFLQTVHLISYVEATAVDDFVSELQRFRPPSTVTLRLPGYRVGEE